MGYRNWLENQVAGIGDDSIAVRMRRKRMAAFEEFFESCFAQQMRNGEIINILDVGGEYRYWQSVGFKYLDICYITLLNMEAEKNPNCRWGRSVEGDATNLREFEDMSFDLCFSNSVIEHVGNRDKQQAMADEMRRVGRHFYLQTPNYWFPFEPHYRLPFVQWFPIRIRAWFGFKWKMGYFRNVNSMEEAVETAEGIRLLTRRDLLEIFGNIDIKQEKVGILTKSFYLCG